MLAVKCRQNFIKYEIRISGWQTSAKKFFSLFHVHYVDIYDSWLAPYFKSIMYTETWQNGRNKTSSNCSALYKVTHMSARFIITSSQL